MAELILVLILLVLASVFSWNLGVRRERGRQARLEEVQAAMTEKIKRKRGTRLRTIRVRR